MRQTRWLNRDTYRMSACLAAIAVVWLVVLPIVGQHPNIDAHIRRNERLGIDPSAKYYTELPAMPRLYEHVRYRRGNSTSF